MCVLDDRRGCNFSHALDSADNRQILTEHGLEHLSRVELGRLLLQSDDRLLPRVSGKTSTVNSERTTVVSLTSSVSPSSALVSNLCTRYVMLTTLVMVFSVDVRKALPARGCTSVRGTYTWTVDAHETTIF